MLDVTVPVETIRTLSLALIVTSVFTVEARRLKTATMAYMFQALLIVALLVSFGTRNHALYWWAATALVTKAILIPYFTFRAIREVEAEELPPLVGFVPSMIVAALLMILFFRATHSNVSLLAPSAIAQEEVYRTNLAVAATVFGLGLYALLTRRDGIKLILALCLLENGVHLSLVSLAPDLSETALFGVASEVVVTVFLLLYVIKGVHQAFGTTDTLRLRELQW